MTTRVPWLFVLTSLTTGRVGAQDVVCRGWGPSPTQEVISIDLMKPANGGWRMLHARIGDDGVTHATSIHTNDGTLTVTSEELHATYAGPAITGPGVIRGAWTRDSTRMPLAVTCRAIAPAFDASPHTVKYIAVQKDVKLEVLDWGGSGRAVVLVHGLVASAHDFDNFAPDLAREYHVYGITRRGSGRSSWPDSGYSSDRLGDDIVAVLDSLHLDRPVLVGHSAGGIELSSVGARYPQRVAGLVYLDAAYPYAYTDSTRAALALPPSAWPKCPCSITEHLSREGQPYRHFPLPVLAIYAMKADWDTRSYDDRAPDWTPAQQAREFEKGVPTARVVRIPNAAHYVFNSNEAQVLSEMRVFIRSLSGEAR